MAGARAGGDDGVYRLELVGRRLPGDGARVGGDLLGAGRPGDDGIHRGLCAQAEFRAGAIGIGWDPATAQLILEAHPLPEGDELDEDLAEEPPAPDAEMMRVKMPVGTARAFARRTREVVNAGRPLCTLCGRPIDPEGHTCTFPEF